MNIPGWDTMNPAERMVAIQNAECSEHDYEPVVNVIGKESVMQICKNCLDMQGWIYNWQES